MGSQRFRAVIATGPGNSAVITMPFDPDEAWGAKANHPVRGTINSCRIRTRLLPADGGGWVLTLAQFYRRAYLRWIDATSRRPDVRAARIAEMVDLLAAGIKERSRS